MIIWYYAECALVAFICVMLIGSSIVAVQSIMERMKINKINQKNRQLMEDIFQKKMASIIDDKLNEEFNKAFKEGDK